MWIIHSRYEATSCFIGLIWQGWAVVGLDIARDAWGIILGKYYLGWYWE